MFVELRAVEIQRRSTVEIRWAHRHKDRDDIVLILVCMVEVIAQVTYERTRDEGSVPDAKLRWNNLLGFPHQLGNPKLD